MLEKFPPLYACSVCGKAVKVTPQGEGVEPLIEWSCGHDGAKVYAERKVTLRGKGAVEAMSLPQRWAIKATLNMRQFLSLVTGRSI